MAQVTVKINGYSYVVGCEDGQEDHLTSMSEQVESRIESIKALGGNSGEARLLVMTALLMADELHDMRIELDTMRAAGARAPAKPAKGEAELTRKISRLASRAEQIAADLQQP